jgi:hypothetical protein
MDEFEPGRYVAWKPSAEPGSSDLVVIEIFACCGQLFWKFSSGDRCWPIEERQFRGQFLYLKRIDGVVFQ